MSACCFTSLQQNWSISCHISWCNDVQIHNFYRRNAIVHSIILAAICVSCHFILFSTRLFRLSAWILPVIFHLIENYTNFLVYAITFYCLDYNMIVLCVMHGYTTKIIIYIMTIWSLSQALKFSMTDTMSQPNQWINSVKNICRDKM